jgi:hypothetical protein
VSVVLRGSEEHGIIGVGLGTVNCCFNVGRSLVTDLYMLLQILGALEGLSTEVALVGLQGNMDADVGSDVVSLDRGGAAGVPTTSQIQVVGALTSDMLLTDMVLDES